MLSNKEGPRRYEAVWEAVLDPEEMVKIENHPVHKYWCDMLDERQSKDPEVR